MFDGSLPEVAGLAALDDAALLDAARGWSRAENAAGARKVAVMAELFARRTGCDDAADRDSWWVDPQAAVAAEVSAAVNVSQGMALHQTHRGVALRDRLPAVGKLFEAGVISDLLVHTIVWRTWLITDPEAVAALDAALAARVTRWGVLSAAKTEAAIDALVEEHDAGAVRRSRAAGRARGVQFGSPADEPGFTSLWARLYASDAALVEQRVEEMARSVCEHDPRTADERRADALGALGARTELVCGCGQSDCPGAAADGPAKNAVVYAVADERSVQSATAQSAAECSPSPAAPPAAASPECAAPPAFVFGAGVLPSALLAGIVERARIRQVRHPGADTAPEPRYTPSVAIAEFVRCRDLGCRFPGCDKPAQFCDIDHTVPYPVGPTHPSNLKCLSVPFSPPFENVLDRTERVAGSSTARRYRRVDLADRAHLHDISGQQTSVPAAV